MPIRWEHLPEALRQRVVAPRRRAPTAKASFRCRGCGELLEDVTPAFAERHAKTHGGAALELVLYPEEPDE